MDKETIEEAVERFGTPIYLYDETILRKRVRMLLDLGLDNLFILYALKANSNPTLLSKIKDEGGARIGVDAVSPEEVSLARQIFPSGMVVFTGNNLTTKEALSVSQERVVLNIDSLSLLERIGSQITGERVWIRVNPDVGAGHHEHCITGGPESKFGIWHKLLPIAKAIVEKHNLQVTGLHQHIGSGILDTQDFQRATDAISGLISHFSDTLEFVDFGGGLGIPYKPNENPLDLAEMKNILAGFSEKHPGLTLVIEPGRFITAGAGLLVVEVTTLKHKPGTESYYVGVNSGFNHLARPIMYGAYHGIHNVSNLEGEKIPVDVVGNLCESGDCFARGRRLEMPREGDILVIEDAGAYGYSMASFYNLRPMPQEILLDKEGKLIRIRGERRA